MQIGAEASVTDKGQTPESAKDSVPASLFSSPGAQDNKDEDTIRWTAEVEYEFKKLYNESVANGFLCTQCSAHYTWWALAYKVLMVLLSTVVTLLTSLTAYDPGKANTRTLQLVSLALSALLSAISGTFMLLNYDRQAEQFRKAGMSWNIIRAEIHYLFVFDKDPQRDAKRVLELAWQKKIKLYSQDLRFPSRVLKKYKSLIDAVAPREGGLFGPNTNYFPDFVDPMMYYERLTPKEQGGRDPPSTRTVLAKTTSARLLPTRVSMLLRSIPAKLRKAESPYHQQHEPINPSPQQAVFYDVSNNPRRVLTDPGVSSFPM